MNTLTYQYFEHFGIEVMLPEPVNPVMYCSRRSQADPELYTVKKSTNHLNESDFYLTFNWYLQLHVCPIIIDLRVILDSALHSPTLIVSCSELKTYNIHVHVCYSLFMYPILLLRYTI